MDEVKKVIDHYRTHHPRFRGGEKEKRLISARLKDGYSVQELIEAIDGCHLSKYHSGDNDRANKYQSLELIVRDSKHVTQFLEIYDDSKSRSSAKILSPPPIR